jgi:hypothetical protein
MLAALFALPKLRPVVLQAGFNVAGNSGKHQ